tara:strand:- start:2844 stop:4073 length:1230 start_codon:yes stop_codon:yes gene_type:complete
MNHNDYFAFENKFRGPKENVLTRLEQYSQLVELISIKSIESKSLDIGCGRGEWLDFCKSKGMKPLGIENNLTMVKECRKSGFDVKQGDALYLLKQIPKESLSLVSSFHLIEHLTFDYLNELLSECFRVIAPGGLLLLETPSIDNISVSTKLFYTDPTHINPINPDALIYFLNNIGFDSAKYFYINGGPLQDSNPANLTRLLNGIAQDICIIATKDKSSTELYLSTNASWSNLLNIGINTIQGSLEFDAAINEKETKLREQLSENQIEIYSLTKKLMILEKRISHIEATEAKKKCNLISLLKSFIKKVPFLYRILKYIRRVLSSPKLAIYLKRVLFKQIIFSSLGLVFLRISIIILRRMNLHSFADKFQKKYYFLRLIYNISVSDNFNNLLENHYQLNPKAKLIYKDLMS